MVEMISAFLLIKSVKQKHNSSDCTYRSCYNAKDSGDQYDFIHYEFLVDRAAYERSAMAKPRVARFVNTSTMTLSDREL